MLVAEAIADVYKSESPAWGERGFLMEKRRVGTARFMSRSTDAGKGSTDTGAGSGPRITSCHAVRRVFVCVCELRHTTLPRIDLYCGSSLDWHPSRMAGSF
jgi:hypothetical protein